MKFLLLASLAFASTEAPKIDYSKYAPPTLPTELSEKIQNYLDIRAPGAGILAPNGKQLFFSWNVTGTPQVWRLDGAKGFPVQMTGGELVTSVQDVSPDGKWVVLHRDRGGEENPGIYLLSPRGGALKVVQHKPKVQSEFGFISRDSKWLYYKANDIKPDAYAIYRYSLADGSTELLVSEPGLWDISDYKDDGTLLLSKNLGNFEQEIYEWSPATKALKPLIGQGEKLPFVARYGARPGELLVNTFKFGEFFTLYSWRDGKYTQIGVKEKWDCDDFVIDHGRHRIAYIMNENGFAKLYAMDARTYKPIDVPKFPDADQVYFGSMDPAGKRMMVSVTTATAPRMNYSYDFATRKLTQWVVPSSPEVDTAKFARTTLESYPARDGTQIPMLVHRSERCRKEACPVLVMFHGGPEGQAQPGFYPGDQLFVEEGFVLVEPNVRGSTGYGRTWLDSDNGVKRLNVITDIEDAGKYARKHFAVDGVEPKVGVMGGSYGGYSTNVAMTLFAGTYDAGAANVGMSNLVTFINNTAPYRRILRSSEYGDPTKPDQKEAMEKLSPLLHVDNIKAPLLLIQGANDPRVPVTEAVQMLEAMLAKKIAGDLIVFADEGHGAQKRGNRVATIGAELMFFRKHLLGK